MTMAGKPIPQTTEKKQVKIWVWLNIYCLTLLLNFKDDLSIRNGGKTNTTNNWEGKKYLKYMFTFVSYVQKLCCLTLLFNFKDDWAVRKDHYDGRNNQHHKQLREKRNSKLCVNIFICCLQNLN
jgi:hypothetical protein